MRLKIIVIQLFITLQLFSQGVNNLWMMGYESQGGIPFGGCNINFISGSAVISYVNRQMNYGDASATICDTSGQVLFSSNAVYVANSQGDTMLNGSGLSPSYYTTSVGWGGLFLPQSVLILPKPGSPNGYYVFHGTVDDSVRYGHFIYYSEIDMTLDGGLGAVTSKNNILLNDTLIAGRISAVKHANGRDWWLLFHQGGSNLYYIYLVDINGIHFHNSISIGDIRFYPNGQVCFSPDGKKLAFYDPYNDLDIMNFDRCTGLLSNNIHIAINDSSAAGGVAFSPNSKVLYVSSTTYVYQFDLLSSNVPGSQLTVAVWDTNYSPNPPLATTFYLSQLAPDGKIYISCTNGTLDIHEISYPDSLGMACQVCQHCVHLPSYDNSTIPNHPNYFLGAEGGSVCDSLPTAVLNFKSPAAIELFPNPFTNLFYIKTPSNDEIIEFNISDSFGQQVKANSEFVKNREYIEVNSSSMSSGIYYVKVRTRTSVVVKKVIKV